MIRTLKCAVLLVVFSTVPKPVMAETVAELNFGRFIITVSDSWTAQVFHIVDMLSVWDASAHLAYSRWARDARNLDDEDRRLLQLHAEMRRVRGWGHGFEQAFLVDDSIETAATKAVRLNLLSADEASSEEKILKHFAPKLEVLRNQQKAKVDAFIAQVAAERDVLAPTIASLIHFAEVTDTIRVPVFIVSNPDARSGGGEANGGRIIVEVPGEDPRGVLVHESLHALLAPKASTIRTAAEGAGLTFVTLNEGIAYAMSPGLTDNPMEADALAQQLARFLTRGTPASDGYVQSFMLAVLLRPIMRAALDHDETVTTFLPKATARWLAFDGK